MINGENRRMLVAAIAGVNQGRYVSISWRKDGGELRTATVNPRDFNDIQGDAASPSAQRAAATRKASNPDLWNVRDHSRRDPVTGKPRWISIRCRGEIRIKQGRDFDVTINLD